MHDNTLTDDNRDKLIQIAERYGQLLKFYNVEELCVDKLAEIDKYFSNVKNSKFSIATFYRFIIPHLLPREIEKVIYLDSDIIVNMDIAEFWQIELSDKPLGAVPNFFQIKDEKISYERTNKVMSLCQKGFVKPEDYFNAGVLLMNLKALNNEEANILEGMKFISKDPEFLYFDQDVLNYCFATSYLKLPAKFNRYVMLARPENELTIDKKIYHYAASKISLGMDKRDPFNWLFLSYFIKTPWVDTGTVNTLLETNLPSRKNCAVSVIIPMYNAEEFINECLDSLVIQTFQDFEVIVVDDCSIDESAAIVESYREKFGERLKLTKTKMNSSGGGHIPRNIGLMLSRGEYVYFMDADDMILGNTLETFYTAAILYDAEVVYTSSYYRLNSTNDIYLYKDGMSKKLINYQTDFTVDEPNKNLSRLLFEPGEGNFHAAWTKFVQRDFLIRNKIFFAEIPNAGDFIWVIKLYCHARRFLRISTPLYLYRRYNTNSILRKVRISQEQCRYWFSAFLDFAEKLHALEEENDILSESPLYSLTALNKHFLWCLNRTEDARNRLDSEELFKILHSEFAKTSLDTLALLLPFFLSFIDNEKKINNNRAKISNYYAEIVNKFRHYLIGKIFVGIDKKMDKETIQILSVSDDNARLSKPEWWQRNGTYYMIDSYTGNLEIVAKAIVAGQVQVRLSGPWVLNPADKTKRIPYWIDYTNLVVNNKTIFNKITPAWNDKPYRCSINAKADEEITIKVEWLPHMGDFIEQKILPPPPPPKVEPIPNKFKNYLTARIDINLLTTEGDFKIISSSDTKAKISQPSFMKDERIGYIVTSLAGSLTLVAKATVDGQLNLKLRGMYVPAPEDKSKAIPYWIDYTALTVNDETIVDTLTPAWHDKPYHCNINAKADEEITIKVEWLPHMGDFIEQKILPPPKVEPIPNKFRNYLTARIDINMLTTEGDFKIISSSDTKAKIIQPSFMKDERIGYIVTSLAGSLTLVAKATVDGQLNLKLRGMYVAEGKSKAIPYWIDYTALTVNDETIVDTLTPVWHDKPYVYNMAVKADEEITIKVEWLPHRGNTKR